MPSDPVEPARPWSVLAAGLLTAAEGSVAVGLAVVLVVRELLGHGDAVVSGYGIAAFFAVLGGAVVAAGWSLVRGQRGGRAPATIIQVLLVPVAWSVLTDSGVPALGVLLGLVVLATLGLLFAPPSLGWVNAQFEVDHPPVPEAPVSARAQRSRRGSAGPRR